MSRARALSGRISALLALGFAAACAVQKQAPHETTAVKRVDSDQDGVKDAKKTEAPPAAPPPPTTGADPGGSGTGMSPTGDASTGKVPPPLVTPATPTTAPPPTTPKPNTVVEPPAKPTPNPGVKPAPDPGVSNVGVAQGRFDDAHAAFVQASGCPAMCKALDSLKNATAHLCALSKSTEPKRCGDAQAKLQKAEAKVKSVCGGCGS